MAHYGGETDLFFQSDLLPDMQYFWRARSTNQNLPETSALPLEGVLEVTTDWSATATFRTPTAEDASTATPAPTAGGTESCCPPPNRLVVVQQVAAQTGYPGSGISVTDFTAAVARALAQEDGDWGRRINDSGPLGKDTVAYRVGGQNDNPYSIDIVSGATGSNPTIHWSEHGRVGGVWTPAN